MGKSAWSGTKPKAKIRVKLEFEAFAEDTRFEIARQLVILAERFHTSPWIILLDNHELKDSEGKVAGWISGQIVEDFKHRENPEKE